MKRRKAKIRALRFATAVLNAGYDEEKNATQEGDIVTEELDKIALSLQARAERMGGEFNPYTGFPY